MLEIGKIMLLQTLIVGFFTVNISRCVAVPTSQMNATYGMEETTVSPLGHDELLNLSDDNEKDAINHWDCQEKGSFIKDQISLTTKMLQDGIEILEKQNNLSKEYTVLVLGKAGCGKSSLVQFLTGNSKLWSKIVKIEAGEYIIEDGVKIGTSAIESKTLYPELINYNSTVNFCDPPGFHDTRSSAHEIVSMNIMKSITDKFQKAKILLLENHSSLQYGVSKDNFMNLLRHVNDFVVDIDRYRDNIALIATKVPFTYRMTDNKSTAPEIIPSEILIGAIFDFLNHTETFLTEKLRESISENEREFNSKIIRLLQSLQTKDQEGKPTRINIFRRPYKTGILKDMPLLEDNKKSLLNTVMNLEFVEVKKNDFDFTLSDTAKMYLECSLKTANNDYKSRINEISLKLEHYINSVRQNQTSFHSIATILRTWSTNLEKLADNLEKTKNYNEFMEIMHQFISTNKLPLEWNYNGQVNALEKYELMLQKFVDTSSFYTPSAIPIRQVIRSVKLDLQWYETLQKLIEDLSSYEVQSNKTEILADLRNKNDKTQNLIGVLISTNELVGRIDIEKYLEVQRNEEKAAEVQFIFKSMIQENNITCDSDGRLTVRGFFVRLNEISSESMVKLYCKDMKLKEVIILAIDTVFIDVDTNDTFKGVNLLIAAPSWKIIGSRKINLSGFPGKTMFIDYYPEWPGQPITKDSYFDKENNGKPGLPGDNGGNFFGIGLYFSNGDNLVIESNGGNGGPGVDGGKGNDGKDGVNGVDKAFNKMTMFKYSIQSGKFLNSYSKQDYYSPLTNESDFSLTECRKIPPPSEVSLYDYVINVKTQIDIYVQDGDCGGDGSPGGNGGEGGLGGFAGKQQLIELSESSQIYLENRSGNSGLPGRSGVSGKTGKNGKSVTYFNVKGLEGKQEEGKQKEQEESEEIASYWKVIETGNSSCVRVEQNRTSLKSNVSHTKMVQPAQIKLNDLSFSYQLFDYGVMLESHAQNAVFSKMITDFRAALKNKFSYNLTEMMRLLIGSSSSK